VRIFIKALIEDGDGFIMPVFHNIPDTHSLLEGVGERLPNCQSPPERPTTTLLFVFHSLYKNDSGPLALQLGRTAIEVEVVLKRQNLMVINQV